jgi:hypothetical protein
VSYSGVGIRFGCNGIAFLFRFSSSPNSCMIFNLCREFTNGEHARIWCSSSARGKLTVLLSGFPIRDLQSCWSLVLVCHTTLMRFSLFKACLGSAKGAKGCLDSRWIAMHLATVVCLLEISLPLSLGFRLLSCYTFGDVDSDADGNWLLMVAIVKCPKRVLLRQVVCPSEWLPSSTSVVSTTVR